MLINIKNCCVIYIHALLCLLLLLLPFCLEGSRSPRHCWSATKGLHDDVARVKQLGHVDVVSYPKTIEHVHLQMTVGTDAESY